MFTFWKHRGKRSFGIHCGKDSGGWFVTVMAWKWIVTWGQDKKQAVQA